jgi:biotin operon repressor
LSLVVTLKGRAVEITTLRRSEVKLLRWPAESARRARYRALGVPRLLVVEGEVPAPVCSDLREDWVRAPITRADLRARIAALQARVEAHQRPQVDPFGILRFADRSVSVSPTETDLLECLTRQFGSLVPRQILRDCLPERPGGVSRNALDLHIMRLRRRIRPLGLVVRNVRGRGYLLEGVLDEGVGGPGEGHTVPARYGARTNWTPSSRAYRPTEVAS